MQLNELAKRLKFIEQKLLENELNTGKKYMPMPMSSYHPNGYPVQGQYPNQQYLSGYLRQNASSNPSNPYSYISQ